MTAISAVDRYRAGRWAAARSTGAAVLALLAFAALSIWLLDVPLERLASLPDRIGHTVATRLLPIRFNDVLTRRSLLLLLQTVEMSVVGSVLGFLLAVPLAWCAAANVTPGRRILLPLARAAIVVGRGVPAIMWGLIFVAVLGFGPLAGTVALLITSVGFAGKLMTEQVETIDMGPVEALRAVGAPPVAVFLHAVLPQVRPAWAGIFVHNWDVHLRGSTTLGFVGAGGIGLLLRQLIATLDYNGAMGVVVVITLLVLLSEALSHLARRSLA